MKRHALILSILALFTLSFASVAFAEHSDSQTGKAREMKEMKNKAPEAMDMSTSGKVIRTHNIDGLRLTYRLINMQERMEKMAGMEKMADKVASHHLMIEVKKIGGGALDDAKVGFVVKGPDGKKHKAMTMAMGGGFGADVDMKARGNYEVKVKIKSGYDTVKDEFTYYAE